jgi:glycerol-3-phosphate cytidylyltransferase
MIVITFGTFDLFHIGHLKMLNRCKKYGDKLIVGVSSDNLNYLKKNRYPIISQNNRIEIIKNIKVVDKVFIEESLELKEEYIKQYKADIFIIGDDWKGRFDHLNKLCKVIYLPRTKDVSTTNILKDIKKPIKDRLEDVLNSLND